MVSGTPANHSGFASRSGSYHHQIGIEVLQDIPQVDKARERGIEPLDRLANIGPDLLTRGRVGTVTDRPPALISIVPRPSCPCRPKATSTPTLARSGARRRIASGQRASVARPVPVPDGLKSRAPLETLEQVHRGPRERARQGELPREAPPTADSSTADAAASRRVSDSTSRKAPETSRGPAPPR